MTERAATPAVTFASAAARRRKTLQRTALQGFLIFMAVLWLVPLAWAVYTSFRPREDTLTLGYVSIGGAYNLDNYFRAWDQGQIPLYFFNTAVILIPAVILVLLLASMMAFAVSRYSWRANVAFLMLFTGANLLPPQVIITPLYRLYLLLPLPEILNENGLFYDSYFGVMLIHVAFQLGFCTFVLSNYMKTLPKELNEAAVVDGAGVWRTYWSVILPLTRPALAALATLQVTWIYNDFFWALILMVTGNKRPITTALNQLQGQFIIDNNLIAAGSMIVAIPTLVVFFALQKQFVSGLTLGSTKG